MVKGYKQMSQTEISLAKKWRQQGKSLRAVAELLGRNKEAVREQTTPAIVKKKAMKVKGRPRLIPNEKFQKIDAMTENMIKVADCRWEVTLDMVKRKAQFKGTIRTLGDAFRSRGVYFRNLPLRPATPRARPPNAPHVQSVLATQAASCERPAQRSAQCPAQRHVTWKVCAHAAGAP